MATQENIPSKGKLEGKGKGKHKKDSDKDCKENLKSSQEILKNLMDDRKLILLVDLDNTILHTRKDQFENDREDLYHFPNKSKTAWYHMKVRPLAHQSLMRLTQYYKLYVCTLANSSYAKRIVEILDPFGLMFEDKIISNKNGLFNDKTKYIDTFFKNLDNAICIIDDREDTWKSAPNLVKVNEYRYFKAPEGVNEKTWVKDGRRIHLFVKEGDIHNYNNEEVQLVRYEEKEEPDSYFVLLYNYLADVHKEFFKKYDEDGTMDMASAIKNVERNF